MPEESGFHRWACGVCGSTNEVFVEPSAGNRQEFTEDCTTCCRPHLVKVLVTREGDVHVEAYAEA